MREASVVCQHFGYTLQPDTWKMRRPADYDTSQPIMFSYVRYAVRYGDPTRSMYFVCSYGLYFPVST